LAMNPNISGKAKKRPAKIMEAPNNILTNIFFIVNNNTWFHFNRN